MSHPGHGNRAEESTVNEFFRTEKVRTAPAATHSATHSNALVENPFEEIAVQPEPAATER
ncbi:hypothetical protein ASG41_14140 [Modestobacter sp. Leaf380]|nr:hypothetical protein ASG41_14140 [Modestobacter sp. Leaf380]